MRPAYLSDRSDPRTVLALTRECSICKAAPGSDCRNPWRDAPPMDRIVHQDRAESHLDKPRRTP